MATTVGGLDLRLFIGDTLEVETAGSSMPWPVPNGTRLRTGPGGAFGESGQLVAATYSNLAMWTTGNLPPDVFLPSELALLGVERDR